MAENFKEPFVNPYVDDDAYEAQFSTFVSMDEAHERWNNGTWQGKKPNFELDPSVLEDDKDGKDSKLTRDGKGAERAKENRFAFNLQKDIIEADQLTSHLDENAYTGNYRPQGSIGSTLSNIQLDRLKYNALADIKEELPEDLSYLYGEGEGSRFKKREVKLRSYSRLKTSVDKRRAEVEKMIPDANKETPEAIMADIRRKRDIEDAKSGIDSRARRRVERRGIYDVRSADGSAEDFYTAEDEYDIEGMTERGSWRGTIPVQDGLVPDSREIPHFGRFSRRWSKIDDSDPTRSDMLRHTVDTIYENREQENENARFRSNSGAREYYVPDSEFDPRNRYRRLQNQRRAIHANDDVLSESVMNGQFNNPYVSISNERLHSLLNHDMRGPGHVSDPEGLTDPALMYEWNMGYSRIHSKDNTYTHWLDEQSRLAEMAEQSRYRGSHRTGRPGAYLQREKPYGSERKYPRGSYTEHRRERRDMEEQLRRATERGIADGREMIRLQQKARREEEQARIRQIEEQQRRAYEQQRRAYEQQMNAYRRQQEQMMRQASRRQTGEAPGGAQQSVPPKPQYGPMGFYTPKQAPAQGQKPAGRRARRR